MPVRRGNASMTQFRRSMRLLATCLLVVGLNLSDLCPCVPSKSRSECGATNDALQKARKCGSCTEGEQRCRMPCCLGQAPEQGRNTLPIQGSAWSVTSIAKAISPANSGCADPVPSRALASAVFDLTSHAAPLTLQSQHVCLQI